MKLKHTNRVPAASRRGFTLIELLCVIAIVGVLASLLMPSLARGKSRATDVLCRSNLRQLGLAVRMYVDDHNSKLPMIEPVPSYPIDPKAPLPSMKTVLAPYLSASTSQVNTNMAVRVLRCPSDRVGRFEKEGTSYDWNFRLNGSNPEQNPELMVEQIKLILQVPGESPIHIDEQIPINFGPAETPLSWDYENFHIDSGAPKNVLYSDGHVASLK
jgi:prepilin-type N-terminal cleavage/methylation domain-containing protein/prepilin-type processing-associated H-X9-DG protein